MQDSVNITLAPFRPFIRRKPLPRKKPRSPYQSSKLKRLFIWEKKLICLSKSTASAHVLIVSPNDRVDKVFIWRKVGPACLIIRCWPYHHKSVTHLIAELTFCFSCERFVISELTQQDGRGNTTARGSVTSVTILFTCTSTVKIAPLTLCNET